MLQFRTWLESSSNAQFYWISPHGEIVPVQSGTHIEYIFKNPKKFGFTTNWLKSILAKHKEVAKQEGRARDEIMIEAMKRGWIRIRRINRPYYWSIEGAVINHHFYQRIKKWALEMLGTGGYGQDEIWIASIYDLGHRERYTFSEFLSKAA